MPCDRSPGGPAEESLARIRLAAFDVDGVLTDGRFQLLSDGGDAMEFHTRDGLALKLLQREGVEVALITGRSSEALRRRAELLGIRHAHRGVTDKARVLEEVAAAVGADLDETLYMGDDLPDLPALLRAGVAAAPADAVPEVRAASDLVTERSGGDGAVREVAERLLRARGRWESLVGEFTKTDR